MKDGMILYSSYIEKFKKLSDEQFGQLIRLIFQYQIDGVVPSIEDTATRSCNRVPARVQQKTNGASGSAGGPVSVRPDASEENRARM